MKVGKIGELSEEQFGDIPMEEEKDSPDDRKSFEFLMLLQQQLKAQEAANNSKVAALTKTAVRHVKKIAKDGTFVTNAKLSKLSIL